MREDDDFEDALQAEAEATTGRGNVALYGATGAGKPTLLAAAAGGKMAAASLIKLVPGVGVMISAGVAAGVTGVLGESWRLTTERAFKGDIDLGNAETLVNLAKTFAENVKNGTGPREAVDN